MKRKPKDKRLLVGLVGEDPNDTNAMAALLNQRYAAQVRFVKLGERMTGDKLETKKACGIIGDDFADEQPRFVVVIRDLDALESDAAQRARRDEWFANLNREALDGRGLFLLHIYELEALLAAHPEVVSAHYKGAAYKPQSTM